MTATRRPWRLQRITPDLPQLLALLWAALVGLVWCVYGGVGNAVRRVAHRIAARLRTACSNAEGAAVDTSLQASGSRSPRPACRPRGGRSVWLPVAAREGDGAAGVQRVDGAAAA
jgi:hypothetical protein